MRLPVALDKAQTLAPSTGDLAWVVEDGGWLVYAEQRQRVLYGPRLSNLK